MAEVVGVFLVLLCLWIVYLLLKSERRDKQNKRDFHNGKLTGSIMPDKPMNFPSEAVWFSVKAREPEQVAKAFGLTGVVPANWEQGLDYAAEENCVFLTPPIEGWVLVTGLDLPMGNTARNSKVLQNLLKKISAEFWEVCFFASFHNYYCWAKAINGQIVRMYAYDGNSDGYFSMGEPLGAERWYRWVDKTPEEDQDYWSREGITFPDSELVRKIAADWNIDPSALKERKNLAGLGLAGILNNN